VHTTQLSVFWVSMGSTMTPATCKWGSLYWHRQLPIIWIESEWMSSIEVHMHTSSYSHGCIITLASPEKAAEIQLVMLVLWTRGTIVEYWNANQALYHASLQIYKNCLHIFWSILHSPTSGWTIFYWMREIYWVSDRRKVELRRSY